MVNQDSVVLQFRGGLAGAFAPLVVFITGVAYLAISGAPNEVGFWPILIAAITCGLIACRDRFAYSEAVIGGMSQSINMVMILAWLLAGILAELMKESGFVDALVWLAQMGGVSGAGFVIASFLIACAISTSTGTSLGTLILCTPLLYPAGGPLGADPATLLGAILGGATFGDNLSPVSDTTIASSVSQGAKLGDVVRTRLRYALPAAAIAIALFFALGQGEVRPVPAAQALDDVTVGHVAIDAADADPSAASRSAAPPTVASTPLHGSPNGLPMAIAPGLVILLLLYHRHLLEGLLFGNLAAIGLGLGLGLIEPGRLMYIDHAAYRARGLLIEGMEKSIGVAIFTLLLMGLVAGMETAGYMQRLLAYAERKIHTARSAEWWAFGTVSVATLLTTHSVVALLSVSRFVRETGSRNGVGPNRRANLLDTTVCTYPFLLPYCIPTILAASLSQSGVAFGMPMLPALEAGLYNFHSWALLAMVLFAIGTGWGRTKEDPPRPKGAPRPRLEGDDSGTISATGLTRPAFLAQAMASADQADAADTATPAPPADGRSAS